MILCFSILSNTEHDADEILFCAKQEKTMKNHWQKKLDEGITPEQARDQYVELVEKFKKTYGTK